MVNKTKNPSMLGRKHAESVPIDNIFHLLTLHKEVSLLFDGYEIKIKNEFYINRMTINKEITYVYLYRNTQLFQIRKILSSFEEIKDLVKLLNELVLKRMVNS